MLKHPGGAATRALKARLQTPDLAHVGNETALNGEFFGLLIQHRVHGLHECRNGVLARFAPGLPAVGHALPQQRGKQEARRNKLAGAHPLIGLRQGQFDKTFAVRLLQNHIEQGQHAMVQAFLAQPSQAGHGMT